MKKLATALSLTLITNIALCQINLTTLDPGSSRPIHGKSQTVTKSESDRPVVRLPAKPKLLRSNPYRFTAIRFLESDPWATPDDEDMAMGRNRNTVVKVRNWDPELDISDYARTRLWLARQLAIKKYLETHSTAV
jgi:hypothetical protein